MNRSDDRLKVYYPHGGPHFLLHWHTDHNRGHVIVARTEAALRTTFGAVLRKEPFAQVLGCWHVEIVAPSESMHADYAADCYKKAVEGFWSHIGYHIERYVEKRGTLPPGLARCANYAPTLDLSDEEDQEYAAECAAKHRYCANCHDGVVPVGMTMEECYERKHAHFERLLERVHAVARGPHRASRPDPARESYATPARDGEPLGRVIADHGPHSSGTYVELAREADDTHRPWSRGTLFYFRDAVPLDATPYQRAAANAEAVIRAEREACRKREAQEREKYERAELGLIDELFG